MMLSASHGGSSPTQRRVCVNVMHLVRSLPPAAGGDESGFSRATKYDSMAVLTAGIAQTAFPCRSRQCAKPTPCSKAGVLVTRFTAISIPPLLPPPSLVTLIF